MRTDNLSCDGALKGEEAAGAHSDDDYEAEW